SNATASTANPHWHNPPTPTAPRAVSPYRGSSPSSRQLPQRQSRNAHIDLPSHAKQSWPKSVLHYSSSTTTVCAVCSTSLLSSGAKSSGWDSCKSLIRRRPVRADTSRNSATIAPVTSTPSATCSWTNANRSSSLLGFFTGCLAVTTLLCCVDAAGCFCCSLFTVCGSVWRDAKACSWRVCSTSVFH